MISLDGVVLNILRAIAGVRSSICVRCVFGVCWFYVRVANRSFACCFGVELAARTIRSLPNEYKEHLTMDGMDEMDGMDGGGDDGWRFLRRG